MHKISLTLIFFLGMSLLLFMVFYSERDLQSHFDHIYTWIKPKISVRRGYLVDTSGCQMPELDPFHPTIKKFYTKVGSTWKCKGKPSFLRVYNNTLLLDDDVLERFHNYTRVHCQYKWIRRNPGTLIHSTDDKFYIAPDWLNVTFGEPIDEDAVRVLCKVNSKVVLQEYVALVRLKSKINESSNNEKLNVIFIGIDSISKLNFKRHFIKTGRLLNEMKFFELSGYSKVGDNTFPNVYPLLTGNPAAYISKKSGKFYDDKNFIWKHYSKLGYRTLLIEDAPTIATFNFNKNGFKKPPTDYYLRPLTLAVEHSTWRVKSRNFCFAGKMENRYFYDHTLNFIDTMDQRSFFAFVFMARLTHDRVNNAGYADAPAYDFLKSIKQRGLLNNSLIFFFSDHGIRFGPIRSTYVGKLEENWPFMFLSVPDWFLNEHNFANALVVNNHRLSTPFDVHQTLVHHLRLMGYNETSGHGLSLFSEINEDRTCEDAGIASHWCNCQMFKRVDVNLGLVREAATELTRLVNLMTKDYPCVRLRLKEVVEARMAEMKYKKVPFGSDREVLVTIVVSPSNGHFESTLRKVKGQWRILGDVSRIDHYGSQGDCVEDAVLRKYCFCTKQG